MIRFTKGNPQSGSGFFTYALPFHLSRRIGDFGGGRAYYQYLSEQPVHFVAGPYDAACGAVEGDEMVGTGNIAAATCQECLEAMKK